MKVPKLGNNGPAVSAIGLGCMGMSEFYGPADEVKSIDVIHHALELIPIIDMTAHAFKDDRERCIKAGMDDYISKPIIVDELLAMITKHTGTDGGNSRDHRIYRLELHI